MKKVSIFSWILCGMILSVGQVVHARSNNREYVSYEYKQGELNLQLSDGLIKIIPKTSKSVEVVFSEKNQEVNIPSYATAGSIKKGSFKLEDSSEEHIKLIQEGGITVFVKKSPFNISFSYHGQEILREDGGYFKKGNEKGFRFKIEEDEVLYGGGSRVLSRMNRRGESFELYNRASYGYETEAKSMYYSMPCLISSKKYALVFDNVAKGYVNIDPDKKGILEFGAYGGRTSYLLTAGKGWPELMKNFTELVGRQPMLPRWAMGNITSRMGYHTQEEVMEVVGKYKKDDIPLDALVLDIYWFGPELKGSLGNLDWYKKSFPKPVEMMKELKQEGIRTVLITEPFILTQSSKWEEAVESEILGTNNEGKPYTYEFFFGETGLIDIFKPKARDWFWDIYKKHTLTGVDGWWGDLGEPEVHPDDLLHVNGRGDEVHNAYGHEWARLVYEGYSKDFPNKRPVILMRSGFVGSQRYGMVPWSGDVNRTWGGLQPQVEICLQMGLQGCGYMHSDLGGFAGSNEDAELYTRWLQYGVFQPVYRTHAQEDVPPEPVFWDKKTKDIVRKFIKLRYEMLPYNYNLMHENAEYGMPLMRPLMFLEGSREMLTYQDAYMWGDAFLVSPVTQDKARSQKIYLPKGYVWYDYWSGERHEGGKEVRVKVNRKMIPLFIKAGSFVPMINRINNTDEYTGEHFVVHYYADDTVEKSSGYIYDDDGKTQQAYNKNLFEKIHFESEQAKGSLVIKTKGEGGSYEGWPKKRKIDFLIHNLKKQPKVVKFNGDVIKVTTNIDDSKGSVALWIGEKKQLKVFTSWSGEESKVWVEF